MMKKFFALLSLSLLVLSCRQDVYEPVLIKDFNNTTGAEVEPSKRYDVVVYGATPAGITAAIEVKNQGKSVLMINPANQYMGGMITNGLGATDYTKTSLIGGLTKDFFVRIKKFYSDPSHWFSGSAQSYSKFSADPEMMLWFEPKAAKSVFKDMIIGSKIPVLHGERLDLSRNVKKNNAHQIVSIRMESGKEIFGSAFIDATYEGDLMAKAGVSYTVGRESVTQYGENLAGVQKDKQNYSHQNPDGIVDPSYFNPNVGANGAADKKLQAYCFRMCLTNIESNRIPFSKPANYDESQYQLLFKYLEIYRVGKNPSFIDFTPMPNGKTDSNNSGPISTNYVGKNYDYADGNYATRERIIREHQDYQMGLMWTLAYSEKVPEEIRNIYSKWGLPKDEFITHNNWPAQLYVREGRRMVGSYVMTQANCENKVKVEQSIGFGSYWMDVHTVQRYTNSKGYVKNEGSIAGLVQNPYPVDYRSLIPKPNECSNLLVPVCMSASHVAYSSLRMEPNYMTFGQVAGIAAALAVEQKKSVQSVSYTDIVTQMQKRQMIF